MFSCLVEQELTQPLVKPQLMDTDGDDYDHCQDSSAL